jgi:very-short-patch-repair endonuclease
MSKRKTIEEWQDESNIIHNKEFDILQIPKSGFDKIDVLHKKCGNVLKVSPRNHLKRYCTYCSGKKQKTKEECQVESDIIHNREFIILDTPKNVKENIRIFHKKCGSIINMTINNHLNHKNGCKKCSKNSLKSNEYWINKCKQIWDDEFKILDYVDNVWKKVRIEHSLCGSILIKDMNNLIHNKRGCSICTRKSYGEFYVKEFLDKNNIKYVNQKSFDGLINPKTDRKLRVDFYLPDYDLVLEIDGVQHYKPIEHWGGEKSYLEQVCRDNIKNDFFGNKLIRINNKKIKDIEKIWQQLQKQEQNHK